MSAEAIHMCIHENLRGSRVEIASLDHFLEEIPGASSPRKASPRLNGRRCDAESVGRIPPRLWRRGAVAVDEHMCVKAGGVFAGMGRQHHSNECPALIRLFRSLFISATTCPPSPGSSGSSTNSEGAAWSIASAIQVARSGAQYAHRLSVNGQVDVLAGGHRKSSLVANESPRGQCPFGRVVRWVSR